MAAQKKCISSGLFITLLVTLWACSNNPTSSDSAFSEEIPQILAVISDDADLFDLSGLEDNDVASSASSETQLAKAGEFVDAIKFGRLGRFERDTVMVDFDTDTTATATIFHTLNGEFLILAKDPSGSSNGFKRLTKAMTNRIVRKVKLVKRASAFADGDSSESRRSWRITHVSLAVGSSESPTVGIDELRISSSALAQDLVITDPLNTFLERRHGIPAFTRHDTIKVFVTVRNSNSFLPEPGETVLLRHRMHRFSVRSRKPLNDDGDYPDAVAGDGIYSGYFVKQSLFGIRHTGLDVFDNGTIYDDAAPYNSVFWVLPYRNRN